MLLTEAKLESVMLPYLLIPQPPAFQREAAHLPRYPTSPLWEWNTTVLSVSPPLNIECAWNWDDY